MVSLSIIIYNETSKSIHFTQKLLQGVFYVLLKSTEYDEDKYSHGNFSIALNLRILSLCKGYLRSIGAHK